MVLKVDPSIETGKAPEMQLQKKESTAAPEAYKNKTSTIASAATSRAGGPRKGVLKIALMKFLELCSKISLLGRLARWLQQRLGFLPGKAASQSASGTASGAASTTTTAETPETPETEKEAAGGTQRAGGDDPAGGGGPVKTTLFTPAYAEELKKGLLELAEENKVELTNEVSGEIGAFIDSFKSYRLAKEELFDRLHGVIRAIEKIIDALFSADTEKMDEIKDDLRNTLLNNIDGTNIDNRFDRFDRFERVLRKHIVSQALAEPQSKSSFLTLVKRLIEELNSTKQGFKEKEKSVGRLWQEIWAEIKQEPEEAAATKETDLSREVANCLNKEMPLPPYSPYYAYRSYCDNFNRLGWLTREELITSIETLSLSIQQQETDCLNKRSAYRKQKMHLAALLAGCDPKAFDLVQPKSLEPMWKLRKRYKEVINQEFAGDTRPLDMLESISMKRKERRGQLWQKEELREQIVEKVRLSLHGNLLLNLNVQENELASVNIKQLVEKRIDYLIHRDTVQNKAKATAYNELFVDLLYKLLSFDLQRSDRDKWEQTNKPALHQQNRTALIRSNAAFNNKMLSLYDYDHEQSLMSSEAIRNAAENIHQWIHSNLNALLSEPPAPRSVDDAD